MSEGTIERLRYEAEMKPQTITTVYPGDVLEVVDASLARAEAAEAALANCQHDLGTMENKVDQANAALEAMRAPCVWRKEYGGWITGGCVNRPIVFASGFAFCPYCGHPIEAQP